MATATGRYVPVGARHARIYALSTSTGVISSGSASTTAYNGVWVQAIRGLELTTPEAQVINHAGDDGIFQVDSLPATEAITGTLTTGVIDLDLREDITGDLVRTDGERKFSLIGSSNQGNEVQVAMLIYQQALQVLPGGTTDGLRRWSWLILPKVLLIPQEHSFGGTEFTKTYTVRPQFTNAYPWGIAFSSASEGATRSQGIKGIAEYKPAINTWTGNATLTTFNLDTNYAAATTAKVKVFVYDDSGASSSDDTSSATITVSTVQPSSTPAASDVVVAFYEHDSPEVS